MLRKLLTLIFVVGVANSLWAQTGTLKGKVTDASTGETLPTANVVIKDGDEIIAGGSTDLDGEYTVKPITPGSYTVEITFVGYADYRVNNVIITADKITYVNAKMQTGEVLDEVVLIEFDKPLINPEGTTSTVTDKEIQSIPQRDVNSIAAGAAGVAQADDGGGINIRGGRSDGTDVYIDGIKVRGQNALPQSTIEQMTVFTGGVPAQFGDATSGSNRYRGYVEFKHGTSDDFLRFGTAATERLRITSAGLVRVPDNGKFTCGAGDDLQIYHNGSNSYITDAGTGYLIVQSNRFEVTNAAGNESIINAVEDGAVELYHNNSKRFETTADGADFSGTGGVKLPVGSNSSILEYKLLNLSGDARASIETDDISPFDIVSISK